ncbi:LysE family transporter [Streptomyces sp. NPDC002138]|uniref:LysE family transporter n=1 Tax=Streptomyces sp. NPDC002138 TaxID=3154410 RepID=UPI003325ACE2
MTTPMTLLTPTLSGAAAGLGVAMPMGAMSVLLLQEAMRSRRAAVAGAAGIAVVDCAYAALATALGPWVAGSLSPVEPWVRLLSATILLTLATHGLRPHRSEPRPLVPSAGSTAGPTPRSTGPGTAGTAPGPGAVTPRLPAPRTARGAFTRYVGLTALNPTTALYFVALTTAQGSRIGTGPAGAAFVVGVLLASLLWQQLLAAAGSFAGSRITETARAWTFRLGYGLIAVYAVKIALPLP